MTVFDDEPDIDWGEPLLLWQWIVDYVTLNRLEQQFAAAFETFVSVTFQPTFHTMEATAWFQVRGEVILPEFSPTRAKISLALEGEPYIPFAAAYEFTVTDGRAPNQCMLAAAMANYYMYVGLYALLANDARTCTLWHYSTQCLDEDMFVLKTPYARAAAISAVTGKEFTTLMTDGCSYRPTVEDLGKVNSINVSRAIDNSVNGSITIDRVPSFVSGALIYGTTVGHFDHLSHLTPLQEIKMSARFDPDESFKTTLQLSNLYRVFGHDLTWFKRVDNSELKPYAGVHTCIVDPYSLCEEPETPFSMRDGISSRREGRSTSFPNLDNVFDEEKIVVRVSKPVLTLCEWNKRERPLPPARFIRKTKTKA